MGHPQPPWATRFTASPPRVKNFLLISTLNLPCLGFKPFPLILSLPTRKQELLLLLFIRSLQVLQALQALELPPPFPSRQFPHSPRETPSGLRRGRFHPATLGSPGSPQPPSAAGRGGARRGPGAAISRERGRALAAPWRATGTAPRARSARAAPGSPPASVPPPVRSGATAAPRPGRGASSAGGGLAERGRAAPDRSQFPRARPGARAPVLPCCCRGVPVGPVPLLTRPVPSCRPGRVGLPHHPAPAQHCDRRLADGSRRQRHDG